MVFVISSCKKENKESLNIGCDSTNVSYTQNVKPILQSNCYNCHSNNNANSNGGGIAIENFDDLFSWIDTNAGSDGGRLLTDIEHKTNPMPKGSSKLPNCDIAKIRNWIKEGGKDN